MLSIETVRFGTVRFQEDEVIEFPAGLPGFEQEHRFLLIEAAESVPLKFLQSVTTPQLSFVCAPLPLVSPNYDMVLPRQDCEALALSADCRSRRRICWARW
jgi:flagellar assembly factor FliW